MNIPKHLQSLLLIFQGLIIAAIIPQITSTTPYTEPESNPEPGNNTAQGIPEPAPDWPSAFQTWKWAWPLHVYLFSALYLAVAIIACVSLGIELVVRMLKFNRLKVSFFTHMTIFTLTRAILLLIDPYVSNRLSNGIPTFVIWSLGTPLILSTFSLLLFALIDTTRIHLTPPRFQNLFVVTAISVGNVCVVFILDIIVVHHNETGILVFLCQLYITMFGLLLCTGFFYVAQKLSKNTNALPINKMKRLQYLVYMSAVIGLCLVASEIYSASEVFGVLKIPKAIPPWPWLGLQTCERIIEICMCVIILLAFKRTKPTVQDHRSNSTV